jgi:hypothetical protein
MFMEAAVSPGLIPDGLVFKCINNVNEPVLPIEVKHPMVYDPHDDLLKQWTEGCMKYEKDLGRSPIRQIYTYMCSSNSKFGILTTYMRTWFLRRSLLVDEAGMERSILEFSPPFYPTSSEPTLAQALVYVFWLALVKDQDRPGIPKNAEAYFTRFKNARGSDNVSAVMKSTQDAPSSDGAISKSSSQTTHGATSGDDESSAAQAHTDKLPLRDIDVEFKPVESFPCLNHGVAYRIDVHGYDSVIKLVDAEKDREGASILAHEAEMYSKLHELWGVTIPSMVFSGPVMLGRLMLAVTYEGSSLDKSITSFTNQSTIEDIKRKARCALAALHKLGFVHGDIALRNIVRNEATGSVKLIDLGNTCATDDQRELANEAERLENVLMRATEISSRCCNRL